MGLTKMAADLSFPWHIYIFKGFWGVQRGFLQKAPLVVLLALSIPDKPKFETSPKKNTPSTRVIPTETECFLLS